MPATPGSQGEPSSGAGGEGWLTLVTACAVEHAAKFGQVRMHDGAADGRPYAYACRQLDSRTTR